MKILKKIVANSNILWDLLFHYKKLQERIFIDKDKSWNRNNFIGEKFWQYYWDHGLEVDIYWQAILNLWVLGLLLDKKKVPSKKIDSGWSLMN